MTASRRRRLLRWALIAAWVALLAVLTLSPQQPEVGADRVQAARGPWGERGVADGLANLLLFLPLGVLVFGLARRTAVSALVGLLLSTVIELAQLVIPGRFPSFWDVAFNAAGTAAGFLLAWHAPAIIAPPPRVRTALAALALLLALLVLGAGPALFAPADGGAPLAAQWTPALDPGRVYRGRVTGVRLGTRPLPPGPLPGDVLPMAGLMAGDTLSVTFAAGPPPPAAVPVFRIARGEHGAALTLSTRQHDLIFSFRTRGAALHLDQPFIRLAGALAGVRAGQLVAARVWSQGPALCLAAGNRHVCAARAAGDTWALLLYPVPAWLDAVLPVAWITLLLVPAGFWLRRESTLALAAALAVATLAAAGSLGLPLPPPAQFLAAPLGLLSGFVLGRAARRS